MIVRRKVSRNFTIITNNCFDDLSLSGELLGLLTYLLSRPNDWQIRPQPLARRMGWGRDKTYDALNALADLLYIERRQQRNGTNGKFAAVEYIVYDERVAGLSDERKPLTEMPLPENQKAAKRINTKDQKILPPKSPNREAGESPKSSPREEFRPSPRVGQRSSERTAKPWNERGKYEAEIIARLGAEGMDILTSLADWRVTQLCRSQSRGALTDDQILELKADYLAKSRR
jgi:hypothetical protein